MSSSRKTFAPAPEPVCRLGRLVPVALALLLLLMSATRARAAEERAEDAPERTPYFLQDVPAEAPTRIREALDLWEPARARSELAALPAGEIDGTLAVILDSRIAFLEGDYARADQLLTELERQGIPAGEQLAHFRGFVARTLAETKNFISRQSEHFEVFFAPGPDEILIEPALETLEAEYEGLAKAFGIELPGKTRVEIAPSGRAFIAISDIDQKAVETTGTIALCKYNRLIVTSPRALPRGYPWRDTLAHELVHYFVYKRTLNQTPVWLHEGIAKYFENLWRGGPLGELSPSHETLLLRALQNDKIIPLARMHPSFVYLDSAEEGAQAFAQVSTIVEYIHQRLGAGKYDLLGRVMDKIAQGAGYEAAIGSLAGGSFEAFYKDWIVYLKARPLRLVQHTNVEEVRFVESEEQLEKQEIDEIDSDRVRELVRVGDLLKNRGRFAGAAEEYDKALVIFGVNPLLLNKLAYAYLQSGQLEKAKEKLDLAAENFPEYGTIYKRLGEFYSLKSEWSPAAESLRRALDLNPFDVEAHQMAAMIYAQLSDEKGLERENRVLKILGAN